MLDIIYPYSFLIAAMALAAWHYYQDNSRLSLQISRLFLSSLLLYILSLAFASISFPEKLWLLFRDFLILAVVILLLARFQQKRWAFLTGIFIFILTFLGYYQKIMLSSLTQRIGDVQLDPSGELLVELKEGVQWVDLEEITKRWKLSAVPAFSPASTDMTTLDEFFVLDIEEKHSKNLPAIKAELIQSGLFEVVEENEWIQTEPISPVAIYPNKEVFGVNDPRVEEMWAFGEMEVAALYNLLEKNNTKPAKKALIVILDTGVDSEHEDLKDRYRSINTVYDSDPRGHGTHCAGIAGAVTNNNIGIASFAPDNRYYEISSIKVLGESGGGSQVAIIRGMIEAADKGADVISMSLGGYSRDKKQSAYAKAVKYAGNAGSVVVCAAGNNGGDARLTAPANVPGVIAVSALEPGLNKAVFSNYLSGIEMGIAAPGQSILSTIPGNGYAAYNGTSMATPYVAGLVGLMKSLSPQLDTRAIFDILHDTGKETNNTEETGKLIIPHRAISVLK